MQRPAPPSFRADLAVKQGKSIPAIKGYQKPWEASQLSVNRYTAPAFTDHRPVCAFIADGYLGTWLLYFLHFFNDCPQYHFAAIYGDPP